jgi:hypothetical protein
MRFCAAILISVLAFCQPVLAEDFTANITVYPIDHFQIGSSETSFGKLSYVGGFAMTSDNRNFGALSAIRILDGSGTKFAAVADTGFFISGTIVRDAALKPVGMGALNFHELPDAKDSVSNAKWEVDSESLVMDGGEAIIGFERVHRLSVFPFDGVTLGQRIRNLDFVISKRELRDNRGFETLARAPSTSPLQGALVAVSEKSIDSQGNIFAAITEGPLKGVFKIARSDEFDITDGDFLPNGDLVILERSFGMSRGIRMRLRKISSVSIKPDAVVEGEILLEANMATQIDNMEGLDIWQATDGTTRLSLVSDDNKSILQRNLYLEFILSE